MKKGMFIVISGPSGVGKGTICKELIKKIDAWYSISMTTREKREGEIDGINYYFVTKEEFERKINNNELLEYATYNGCYYGTPKDKIIEKINMGINVISEIEVQGAKNIKELYNDALLIYLLPPSEEELIKRLKERGTNSKEDIENRLKIAKYEYTQISNYDYVVVNEDINETVDILKNIIHSEQYKVSRNKEVLDERK